MEKTLSDYTAREKRIAHLVAKRRKRAATMSLLRFAISLPLILPVLIIMAFGKACELIVDWIDNNKTMGAILKWSSRCHDEAIRKNNRVLRIARKQYQRRKAKEFDEGIRRRESRKHSQRN